MASELDATLAALADPTRRAVVELLREQPLRSGDIAAALSMSRPATSRHLRVLRHARVVAEQPLEDDARVRLRVGSPQQLMAATRRLAHAPFGFRPWVMAGFARALEHVTDPQLRVELELEGRYGGGARSVYEYLRQTALANPHARIRFKGPGDQEPHDFVRGVRELPEMPREIQPHPYGVELGTLIKMLAGSKGLRVSTFLQREFSRVSARAAKEILAEAGITPTAKPGKVARREAEDLHLHGFIEATRVNSAGKVAVAWTRVTTIRPSSRGCLSASSASRRNSVISSR